MIFLGLLIIGGIAYFLKDADVQDLQSDTVKPFAKRTMGRKNNSGTDKEEKDLGNRFKEGECISNRDDGWEYTKIISVGDHVYRVIDCHKFKGCTEQNDVSWSQIEFEYRRGSVIPCRK